MYSICMYVCIHKHISMCKQTVCRYTIKHSVCAHRMSIQDVCRVVTAMLYVFLVSWTTDAGTSSAKISSEYSCTWWRTGQKHFHLPCPNVRKFHCAALMCWSKTTCQYGVLALLLSSMFSLRVRHARSIVCVFASVSTLLYHSCSDWFTAWWHKIQEWPEPVNNTARVAAVGSVSSKAEVNSDLVSCGILGSSLLSLTPVDFSQLATGGRGVLGQRRRYYYCCCCYCCYYYYCY